VIRFVRSLPRRNENLCCAALSGFSFSSEAYLEGMKTQGRPKNRYQTERVRSLPRRNENAQTTTRSTNPITESEAYLEGMKTWRSATERARGGGSEAYLEGMKTSCEPSTSLTFHWVRSLPRRNENYDAAYALAEYSKSEAYLEGMKTASA